MKEWMDELVETVDGYFEFMGEMASGMIKFVGTVFVLLAFPIWYLPYKFFRKK